MIAEKGKTIREISAMRAYLISQGASQAAQQVILSYQPGFALIPWVHFTRLGFLLGPDRDEAELGALTTAMGFLEVGIDLMDAAMDHELEMKWPGVPAAQATLLACDFMFLWPDKILHALPVEASVRLDLLSVKRNFLARISEGQADDLRAQHQASREITDYLACIEHKTGAWRAMYLSVGARLSGADAALCDDMEKVVTSLGMLSQLQNDCYDFLGNKVDAQNGLETLPDMLGKENLSTCYAVMEMLKSGAYKVMERLPQAARGLLGEIVSSY